MRAYTEIRSLQLDDLAQRVLEAGRYLRKSCVRAFLERCQQEMATNPHEAVKLFVLAPEFVWKCAGVLGDDLPSYLVWSYGVEGSGYVALRSFGQAERAFAEASEHRSGAAPWEVAALTCRKAHLRMSQLRFPEALALADEAMERFRSRAIDKKREREDCSLPFMLVIRGMVRAYGYRQGAPLDLGEAAADFQRCLELSGKRTPRCRLAAMHNLGGVAAAAWLSAESDLGSIDPREVLKGVRQVQAELLRTRIRRRTVVHAKSRWVEGLALAEVWRGLTARAEQTMRQAREDLAEVGAPSDVAELTLDLQWWLLFEGQWGRAAQELQILESMEDRLPATWAAALAMWRDALRSQHVSDEVLRKVFGEIRGIQRVAHPVAQDELEWLGW